jgi:hypothetical protein
MKRFNNHLTTKLLLGASLLWGATAPGQVIGQWDFNSGNLTHSASSTLGDLQYADGDGGATSLGTVFGSTTTLGIPDINGTPALVMGFPAATNNMGYLLPPPPTANGGGSEVNQWTLILDVLYPTGSDKVDRPIIDVDGVNQSSGSTFYAGSEFQVSATDDIGAPTGPYFGSVKPNTWYRLGMVANTNQVSFYINGVRVGSIAGTGQIDTRFALSTASPSLFLGTLFTGAAPGYINSVQLRDVALNAGQMEALGGPSAAGIPQTIPPVPAFVDSSTPAAGATGVGPLPAISVVLNQGDTTVTSASIKLFFDGASLPSSVAATAPTFLITASVTNLLDPSSVHRLSLVWSDSVAGTSTNTWSFTVTGYQSVNLPTAFYLENFDSIAEGSLPVGWVATNATTPETSGLDLCSPNSDSYVNWVVINTNRLCSGGPCSGFECDALNQPPIAVNGVLLDSVAHDNLVFFESDNRCNNCYGQVGMLFTPEIDCTGRTNVFVSWHSLYTQNQDNIGALEYSIDKGTNWLPVIYYLDSQSTASGGTPDVIWTNGVVDVGATFLTARGDQPAGGTNFGFFICAPISTNLIPYVAGRTNDDQVSGKRIETVRLTKADGQANVSFRFVYGGTCSWYWGVDDFGLYEINTPVIGAASAQPQSQTVDAGTPVTFSVSATSASPLTYQWQFGGVNIAGATNSSYTIASVAPGDAGQYKVIVKNSDGNTPSAPATLTVNTTPAVVDALVSQAVDAGTAVSFAPTTSGGHPLTYLWFFNGTLLPSATGNALALTSAKVSDAGNYQLIITNTYGAATSTVAQLTVVSGPITNGLVVHLTFDGNLNDTSGRGNNATYATNGTAPDPNPTFVPGKLGQAFEYTTLIDGSKIDYATFGYPPDLMLNTNSFSVSMWVNYTNQSDDLPFISNKDWNSSGNPGWGMFCQGGGNFRLNITGPNGSADKFDTSPGTVLRDGNWHNLVMTMVRGQAAGAAAAYVDGTRVYQGTIKTQGSIDTAGLPFQNEQSLVSNQSTWAVNLGQDGTGVYHDQGSAYNIGAKLDDLGIWRRALTAGEAAGIYAAGQAGKDLTQAQVSASPSAPTLTVTLVGNSLKIDWQGSTTGRLQTTTSLNPAVWADVPGTTGASTATVSITSASSFFRVKQ